MLKFLFILRSLLFSVVEGADSIGGLGLKYFFWKKYWIFFWWLEGQLELMELGEKGPSISGSERAVLIEQILLGLKNPRILEVGVGFGQNLAILSTILPKEKLTAIDISQERIAKTKEFLGGAFAAGASDENHFAEIALYVADARSLPFDSESFDVVFSSAVFLYLTQADAKKSLSEMVRVSKRRVVLLEQHTSEVIEEIREGGVTGESYFIRDYNSLINSLHLRLRTEEIKIPQPRWGIESWKDLARVFVIEKLS